MKIELYLYEIIIGAFITGLVFLIIFIMGYGLANYESEKHNIIDACISKL